MSAVELLDWAFYWIEPFYGWFLIEHHSSLGMNLGTFVSIVSWEETFLFQPLEKSLEEALQQRRACHCLCEELGRELSPCFGVSRARNKHLNQAQHVLLRWAEDTLSCNWMSSESRITLGKIQHCWVSRAHWGVKSGTRNSTGRAWGMLIFL